MSRVLLVALICLLSGCTSFNCARISSDVYETQYRGAQALYGDTAAFDRLVELKASWDKRGSHGLAWKLMPWDRANRDRAGQVGMELERVISAKDAILGQRELDDVMLNALNDLESEYDDIDEALSGADAPAAQAAVAHEQKYLARRMAQSLTVMSRSDMTGAVEAADLFGRDIARFRKLLDALINGDDERGVEPPDAPGVQDSLAQIDDLFSGYIGDSSDDVLENVVVRNDAWLALKDIAAIAEPAMKAAKKKSVAAPVPDESAKQDAAATPESQAGTDPAVDESTGAEPAADEAAPEGASVDEPGADEPSSSEAPADEPPADDAGADDAAGPDEDAVNDGKKKKR